MLDTLEIYTDKFIKIMDSSEDILNKESQLQQLMIEWNNILFNKAVAKKEKEFENKLDSSVYKPDKSYERSVQFTFGQMNYHRKSYRKHGTIKYPIDSWFELDKYQRYSEKVKFVATKLAGITTYRNVATVFADLTTLSVSKDSVMRLVKNFGDNVLETNQYFKAYPKLIEESKRKKVPFLFIEGDGIIITEKSGEKKEITCFVIHEGIKINGNRKETINKKFIVNTAHSTSVREAANYVYSNYDMKNTIVIANSDGGKGFSKRTFQTIAGLCDRVEYFIDRYHVSRKLKERVFIPELIDIFQAAINEHSLSKIRVALDTLQSNCLSEEQEFHYKKLNAYIKRNWKYLRPLKDRGIDLKKEGIGIMESQLRSIAFRMKRQGKYWGVGLFGMVKIIENTKNHTMKAAFLCEWKHDWELANELDYYVHIQHRAPKVWEKVAYVNRYALNLNYFIM